MCVKWGCGVWECGGWARGGIRGFGIASDDGIFQNVKTNIASPRPLVGMGHLDYDWQRLTLISTAP